VKAPQKKLPQDLSKYKPPRQQHSPKKSLHLMRRQHMLRLRLNTTGISLIFLKRIKIEQMTARCIYEKTEKLFEDLGNRFTFAALSYLKKLYSLKFSLFHVTAAC
jgi:hypothetical protein